jgi:RNA polymerase sigma factor (sigma-70 family)
MKSMGASPPTCADDGRAAGALEDSFARWQGELLGTLFFLVGNLDDARDALQETFLKCWRHRASLGDVQNLKAWIFCIALNTGRDLRSSTWRRRKQSIDGALPMLATHEAGPAVNLERQEDLAKLRRAIADLRPEEQEVFLLRQNGELKYDEIAINLCIPLGTVKTRMRLALEKLRLAMGTT